MEGGKLRIVLSIALIVATITNYATANAETPLTAHSYVTASASVQKGLEMGFQNFKTCIDQCPQGDEACLDKCAEGFLPKDAEGKGLLLLKARFEARLQFCINGCELLRECEKATGGKLPSSYINLSITVCD